MAWRIITADVMDGLATIPDATVQCAITSPPYWGLRDYGTASWSGGDPACDHRAPDEAGATEKPTSGQRAHAGRFAGPTCWRCGATRHDRQIGLEPTIAEYVERMVAVFRQVRRVLKPDGTLWLNLGDSYNAYNGGAGPGSGEIDGPNERSKQRPALPRGYGLRDPILKPKDLCGIPWRVALALQADGWYLRSDIVWHKPNPMPRSVKDRPTLAHEYLFLLSRSRRYYYDADAIAEAAVTAQPPTPVSGWATGPGSHDVLDHNSGTMDERKERSRRKSDGHDGYTRMIDHTYAARDASGSRDQPFGPTRNARSVWTIATIAYPEAHFATFPPELPRRCILAGSRLGDTVLDPFAGAGTTLLEADRLGREGIGIELNPAYAAIAHERVRDDAPLFAPEP